MLRWLSLVATSFALLATSAEARADSAPRKLAFGTLFPKQSSWGRVFEAWRKAVEKKTGGRLLIHVHYGGTQGGENALVSKLKTGQLDGAALSSLALSELHRDVLALQVPGLFDSWSKLDRAKKTIVPEIDRGLSDRGYRVLGWGDIGLVRLMSRGFSPRTPDDLAGHRPLVVQGDPLAPLVYAQIPKAVPVTLTPAEVLPALSTSRVDVLGAPAIAAEQLQWAPRLDHVVRDPSGCAIGATIVRERALQGLPADVRAELVSLGEKSARLQSQRGRRLDEQAFSRMAKRMKVIELSAAERSVWQKQVFSRVRARIGEGLLRAELVARVERALK